MCIYIQNAGLPADTQITVPTAMSCTFFIDYFIDYWLQTGHTIKLTDPHVDIVILY